MFPIIPFTKCESVFAFGEFITFWKDNDDDYKANEVQEKKIPDEKTPDGEVEAD